MLIYRLSLGCSYSHSIGNNYKLESFMLEVVSPSHMSGLSYRYNPLDISSHFRLEVLALSNLQIYFILTRARHSSVLISMFSRQITNWTLILPNYSQYDHTIEISEIIVKLNIVNERVVQRS